MSRLLRMPWGLGRWLRRADILVLLALLALVAGLWLFASIAVLVNEGSFQHLDERILRGLREPGDPSRPRGPEWLAQVAVDLSALGGYAGLTLLTLGVAGFLLLSRKYHALLFLLAVILGGWALSTGLKELFGRPRPAVVPHLVHVGSASFPSGHAMLSAVVYLTLGALLARLVAKHALKLYFILVAAVITLLVGCTRVYLGVHYPTDVLGGWAAGVVWALACWLAARYLQHRGAIERGLATGGNGNEQQTSGGGDRRQ